MTQSLKFYYAPLNTTAAICTSSAMSGVLGPIFSFKALLTYPDFSELMNFSYFGALGAVALLPLVVATILKWKGESENEKTPLDVSKGWFALLIAGSTSAIANSAFYGLTHAITPQVSFGVGCLSGLVALTAVTRLWMDRVKVTDVSSKLLVIS